MLQTKERRLDTVRCVSGDSREHTTNDVSLL